MSVTGPNQTPQPVVSDTTFALAVYVLYIVGYATGLTALIGVIIAHIKIGTADAMLHTHYEFQIRTFWIGLLYLVIGTVLAIAIIGLFVLLWWFIWSLIRIVKGLIALNEQRPIANPTSWLFG